MEKVNGVGLIISFQADGRRESTVDELTTLAAPAVRRRESQHGGHVLPLRLRNEFSVHNDLRKDEKNCIPIFDGNIVSSSS
jgi:hypothetical protein